MKRRVFKYHLPPEAIGAHCTIGMPKDAKILIVNEQYGLITLWAEVDPTAHDEYRYFSICGTGFDLPPRAQYVGTVFIKNFVWHVYEDIKGDT